ncbi:FAD-dependent thymidylate synthase [Microcystis elabens FACHB-917]|nr:FAD-dependent thymidylate synthase [Microcystis elabens FACHB-917]
MDPRFRVELIAATPNPQLCVYAGMHQDYSEGFVAADRDGWPDERKAGEICVKRLLAGERGHYGPLEHAQIVLNVGWFPHSVMQQARTHRVGVSFDVQCLAGDTEVTFVQAGGGLRKIRIAELHDLWTNGERTRRHRQIRGRQGEGPGTYRRDCRRRLQGMRLRVLNEDTNVFETSHLKDVICSGLQPVYRLTMEDGRTLDCTANHRLLTPDGWQTMGEALSLKVGRDGTVRSFRRTAQVLANGNVAVGSGAYRDRDWLQQQVETGATPDEMAERAGCSTTTIRDWARRHQIQLVERNRRFSPGHKPWNLNPSALHRQQPWLQQRLEDGLSAKEMAELAGCSVEAIKKWVHHFGLTLNQRPLFQKGMRPWNNGRGGYRLQLSEASREARRAHGRRITRRGASSHFWKGGASSERVLIGAWTRPVAPQVHQRFDHTCQRCGRRGSELQLQAHHLVPVYADPGLGYEIENLVTLCQPLHVLLHNHHLEAEFAAAFVPRQTIAGWPEKPRPQGRRLMAHPLTVVNVEFLGTQMTYDLEVQEPWHNFVANGLVVHNSMRYTGDRIRRAANGELELEEVFYLRPVGNYSDRQGKKYLYDEGQRAIDLELCRAAAERYRDLLDAGYAEEHARGILPFDYRQHFVVSFTLRAFLHFLDLRAKLDAQQEIRELCDLMWPHLQQWVPEFAEWYGRSRLHRARLAP